MRTFTSAMLAFVLCIVLSLSFSSTIYAQEAAFNSAPSYYLTFDSASQTPGSYEWQPGRLPRQGVAYFNGLTNFINLTTTNDIYNRPWPTSFGGSCSFEVWVAYDTFRSWSHFLDIGNGQENDIIVLGNTGTTSNIRFETWYTDSAGARHAAGFDRVGMLARNNFVHVTGAINKRPNGVEGSADGADMILYIDGLNVGNRTTYLPPIMTRFNSLLGASNWVADQLFNGWIDSFAFYNYGLSGQAVLAHAVVSKVPTYEIAFGEDPRQIAGPTATYTYVENDPDDSFFNITVYHQGVIFISSAQQQYVDLMTDSGSSTIGTRLSSIGGPGSANAANLLTPGMTMEFMFKVTGTNSGSKLVDITGTTRIYLGILNGNVVFGVGSNAAINVITAPTQNIWYHVMVVMKPDSSFSSATFEVTVDGTSVANATNQAYPSAFTPTSAYVGRSTDGSEPYADLKFDAFRIFDYALTNREVTALYYATRAPLPVLPPTEDLPRYYDTKPFASYGFEQLPPGYRYASYDWVAATNDNHYGVASFNGVNSSVDLAFAEDSHGRNFPYFIGGSMTIEVWLKFTTLGFWQRIFDCGGRGREYDNNIVLAVQDRTRNLILQVYSGNVVSDVRAINVVEPGRWYHIVATIRQVHWNQTSPLSSHLELYVDGIRRGSNAGFYVPFVERPSCFIGKSNWDADTRFHGLMENFDFYYYPLDGQQIQAHACGSRPPVFEFAFVQDPRLRDQTVAYSYGWVDSDLEEIPPHTPANPGDRTRTFNHTGILSFNANLQQFVNLSSREGPNTIGNHLTHIGGAGSGLNVDQGWTFEILLKFTGNNVNARIFDISGGESIDNNIVLAFTENNIVQFRVHGLLNGVQTISQYDLINAPALNTWYHIIVIVTPESSSLSSARYTLYLNGEVYPSISNVVYPANATRHNALLARGLTAQFLNANIDSFRIHDYALNENAVRCLYVSTHTRELSFTEPALYTAGARNTWSFQQGYSSAESAIANYEWLDNYDGHHGVARFNHNGRTSDFANLLGYSDDHGNNFPVIMGGTDLSFEVWARFEQFLGFSRIFDISNGQAVDNIALMQVLDSRNLGFHVHSRNASAATEWTSTYQFPVSQWFHCVVTVTRNHMHPFNSSNAATYRVYINSVLVDSTPGYYPVAEERIQVFLGKSAWSADRGLVGSIDLFAWYDHALEPESINVNYGLRKPAIFDLPFSVDPRHVTLGNRFDYHWIPYEYNLVGILSLDGVHQYVNLQHTRGSLSIGAVPPSVGGRGSGVFGTSMGMTFEISFKLSSYTNNAKLFNFGNGAEGVGAGDDNIFLGLDGTSSRLVFEVFNSRTNGHSRMVISENIPLHRWTHVTIVLLITNQETHSVSTWKAYLNDVALPVQAGLTHPLSMYRENCFLGRSEWHTYGDALAHVQIDAFRIFDYALSDEHARALYTNQMGVLPSLGCNYIADVPKGSLEVSIIFAKPITEITGTAVNRFIDIIAGVMQVDRTAFIGCARVFGDGRIANAVPYHPGHGHSRMDLYFLSSAGKPDHAFDKLMQNLQTVNNTFMAEFQYGIVPDSVTSEPHCRGPTCSSGSSGLSGGAIAGIVIGVIIGVILLVVGAFYFYKHRPVKSHSFDEGHATKSNQSYDHQVDDEHSVQVDNDDGGVEMAETNDDETA
jgi:hypothetical protein